MLKSRLNVFFSILMIGALFLAAPAAPVWAQEESSVEETSAGAATHEETAGAEHHEEKGGFPQLDISTYASQVFWLFISFVLIYALMSKVALPKVGAVIDTRNAMAKVKPGKARVVALTSSRPAGAH